MIERSRVRVPAGAAGEFSSPGSAFSADSYFGDPFHPRDTALARERSQSFCQKCRWQVTTKLQMHLTYVALHEVTWHGAWLYGVHCTQRDGSSFTWHQPQYKYTTSVDTEKTRYEKLVTHSESHAT